MCETSFARGMLGKTCYICTVRTLLEETWNSRQEYGGGRGDGG